MKRLEDRVAIVTGAGRGLGKAIAKRFAAEGCAVAVVSLTAANAQKTTDEIVAAGGRAICIPADVTDLDGVPGVVAQVVEAFGTVDILVNNALEFASVVGNVVDLTQAQVARQYLGGPQAALAFMQACYPYLSRRGGRVINMGSSAGVMGAPGLGAYAMAKEAIRALTRCAAREWGTQNITVNCICPIAMTDSYTQAEDTGQLPTKVENALDRVGKPDEDIAPVALFLASEEGRYLTGTTMMADGGFMIDAGR